VIAPVPACGPRNALQTCDVGTGGVPNVQSPFRYVAARGAGTRA